MGISRQQYVDEHLEEGYFVSMTDMMVGMLFLFIIMLMFFALKFNEAASEHVKTVKDLVGADNTRKDVLNKIKGALKTQGVNVEIDTENGILRLPESILFDTNKSELSAGGREALEKLAKSLVTILPRYAFLPGKDRTETRSRSPHSIESIFIEGHTDSTGDANLNWRLSMDRAFNTYQALTEAQEILGQLQNRSGQPLLSIAGYGKQRPIASNETVEGRSRNRRIDLRFIMSPPLVTPQVEDILKNGRDAP
ncbi:MAG: OmpA/MotB family protein [Syntrophobacteraceae bacterium]